MKSAKLIIAAMAICLIALFGVAQEKSVFAPHGSSAIPADTSAVVTVRGTNTQNNQPTQQANIQRPTKRTTNWSRIKDLFE